MIALALQGAAAFNLICTGTYTSGELLARPEETRQVQVTLRVDLARGRWCGGTCETTAPIHRVTDTQITFRYEDNRRLDTDTITTVNRESGEYFDRERFLSFNRYSMTMGTCERAPFTGFPARRF